MELRYTCDYEIAPATEDSAGFDLRNAGEEVTLEPGTMSVVGTSLRVEIPRGYVGKVFIRSSLGFKHGITLANSTGIIDSDYRGEVKACLVNHGKKSFTLAPMERFCQLIIEKHERPTPIKVEALEESARGEGGFGSTGRG